MNVNCAPPATSAVSVSTPTVNGSPAADAATTAGAASATIPSGPCAWSLNATTPTRPTRARIASSRVPPSHGSCASHQGVSTPSETPAGSAARTPSRSVSHCAQSWSRSAGQPGVAHGSTSSWRLSLGPERQGGQGPGDREGRLPEPAGVAAQRTDRDAGGLQSGGRRAEPVADRSLVGRPGCRKEHPLERAVLAERDERGGFGGGVVATAGVEGAGDGVVPRPHRRQRAHGLIRSPTGTSTARVLARVANGQVHAGS